MKVWEMKEAILRAYPPSEKFEKRVENMSDAQTYRFYMRLQREGVKTRKEKK